MGLIEAEIWYFQVAHQGYLPLGIDIPVLKQVALGNRAIGICNTENMACKVREIRGKAAWKSQHKSAKSGSDGDILINMKCHFFGTIRMLIF